MAGVRPPARTSKASKEWWEPEESTGWWDEFKKLGEPRVIRHEPNKYFQTTWEGANASQRAWFKEMGKLDLRLVWRTKGMTMLERQRLYSEFLLPNQWYQATVVAYYEGTEMESVGKSLDKKYKRVDPLDAIVNRKLGVDIAHWYSNGSRVMSSSSRASAVKLATGDRGWIIGGKFRSEHQVQMALRSLDHTVYAEDLDWSLEQTFLNATPRGKREIMEMLEDVDWEAFWKNYYPQDDGYDTDLTYPSDVFYGIADRIEALSKGRHA